MAPLRDDQDHICGVVLVFHEAGKAPLKKSKAPNKQPSQIGLTGRKPRV
jgi:hypothetical protein